MMKKMFSLLTSLILSTFISLVGFSRMFRPVNFGRACVVGETVVQGVVLRNLLPW